MTTLVLEIRSIRIRIYRSGALTSLCRADCPVLGAVCARRFRGDQFQFELLACGLLQIAVGFR
jgi:hypothetical protein